MYIATHLGWVVLSCAVLMFFRKRSIQKKQTKKKSKVSGILPSPTQPRAPSPHGRAPLGMHQAWWKEGLVQSWGAPGGSPLLGDRSVASQALVSVSPDVKFHIVSLRLGAPGRPAAPACAWLLDIEAGAREGGGLSCTEPISTAPSVGRDAISGLCGA